MSSVVLITHHTVVVRLGSGLVIAHGAVIWSKRSAKVVLPGIDKMDYQLSKTFLASGLQGLLGANPTQFFSTSAMVLSAPAVMQPSVTETNVQVL